jgi:hypothetical protein
MVAVLNGYSEDRPRGHLAETGLRKSVFPPRLAEIVAACEAIAARDANRKRYQEWESPRSWRWDRRRTSDPRAVAEEVRRLAAAEELRQDAGGDREGEAALEPQAPSWKAITENYAANPQRLANLISEPGKQESRQP